MKKVLCGFLIVLLSTWLFSDDLQDTITPDSITTDTVSISIINPQTKKEKPHFSIGYNLGVCYRGEENSYMVNHGDPTLDPFELLAATIYALHSIEFDSKYVINKRMFETGID
ncbi:MAG: hypothetical protein AB7T10_04065, partial [bacterium]